MKLYVMRHAKSSWQNNELEDYDRPIKKSGEKSVKLICEFFIKNDIKFDLTYVSSSKRTLQTLRILKKKIDLGKIKIFKKLYLASKTQLISVLRKTNPIYKSILLINHEPSIKKLTIFLCGTAGKINQKLLNNKFSTSSFAEIKFHFDDWNKLTAKSGKLCRFIRPKKI